MGTIIIILLLIAIKSELSSIDEAQRETNKHLKDISKHVYFIHNKEYRE